MVCLVEAVALVVKQEEITLGFQPERICEEKSYHLE